MPGHLVNLILVGLVVLVGISCVLAPVVVLAVMSWHWHKELAESARVRQARSTQVR